jgi:hypothetical protein
MVMDNLESPSARLRSGPIGKGGARVLLSKRHLGEVLFKVRSYCSVNWNDDAIGSIGNRKLFIKDKVKWKHLLTYAANANANALHAHK